jgi:hypothetical protein
MFRHAKSLGLVIALTLSVATALPARDRYGRLNSKQAGYNIGYQDGYQLGRESGAQNAAYDYRSQDFHYADRGYDRSMGEHDDFQKAYRNGYKTGYDDGYYGRPSRFDNGYGPSRFDNGYGPPQRDWQDGDNRGPRDNRYNSNPYYNRDDGYGRNDRARQYGNGDYGNQNVAYNFGYQDGVIQGQKDRNKGKEFRPRKNDRFEDADHGYHREFGNKDYYKQQYRQAFIRGYEDGYSRY